DMPLLFSLFGRRLPPSLFPYTTLFRSNTGAVKRGESVAVIGCGGVGTAAIAGAALGGATTIVAVDLDDEKLATAREFGATHTVKDRKSTHLNSSHVKISYAVFCLKKKK